MRRTYLLTALLTSLALPATAQDQTLADIRQEMSVFMVEIQRLRRELSTTGGVSAGLAGGGTLERVNLIERELQRLTAKTEELEFRINSIVSDGTNRLGDLEFRLCELDPGCDLATLGNTAPLGGAAATSAAVVPAAPPPQTPTAQMAVGEQADFDAAMERLNAADYRTAADRFQAFTNTYTGGPLVSQAHYWRGRALSEMGDHSASARAYLESFSGARDGAKAPDALYGLGVALGKLGQTSEACVTLAEVGRRYPSNAVVMDAAEAMRGLNCQG